jgi:hypothetical protein
MSRTRRCRCRDRFGTTTALPGSPTTRGRAQLYDHSEYNAGKAVLGLNARFRFYRYRPGDYFAPHTDGSWPGSRIIDGQLLGNAYDDRWSQLTFLLFLSDDYDGGATRFHVSKADSSHPARQPDDTEIVDVRTPLGGALCFLRAQLAGNHPRQQVHHPQRRPVRTVTRATPAPGFGEGFLCFCRNPISPDLNQGAGEIQNLVLCLRNSELQNTEGPI